MCFFYMGIRKILCITSIKHCCSICRIRKIMLTRSISFAIIIRKLMCIWLLGVFFAKNDSRCIRC
jgi:hypothetical protein